MVDKVKRMLTSANVQRFGLMSGARRVRHCGRASFGEEGGEGKKTSLKSLLNCHFRSGSFGNFIPQLRRDTYSGQPRMLFCR